MNNFKTKFFISILAGLIFSFIFILLALLMPLKDDKKTTLIIKKSKSTLSEISEAVNKRLNN